MTIEEEKIDAIRKVLGKRLDCLRDFIERGTCNDYEYFKGKADGYQQAIDLLNTSLESIRFEL